MKLNEFVEYKKTLPGQSQKVDFPANGSWHLLLIDPAAQVKDAKWDEVALAVQQQEEIEGRVFWPRRTLYMKMGAAKELLKLLPEDGGRIIVTATRVDSVVTDKDGVPKEKPDGGVFWRKGLTFELFAGEEQFDRVQGGVPVRVPTGGAPGTQAVPAAVKPKPKPLV